MRIIKKRKPIREMTNPAMARPRGRLESPMPEKIKPNGPIIKENTGKKQNTQATMDSTNPAMP